MINRAEYLLDLNNFKGKNLIKVVTGIRRCGKSTLFELYQNDLTTNSVDASQIISVNLEDGDFRHLRTAEKLFDYVNEKLLPNRMNYVSNLSRFPLPQPLSLCRGIQYISVAVHFFTAAITINARSSLTSSAKNCTSSPKCGICSLDHFAHGVHISFGSSIS